MLDWLHFDLRGTWAEVFKNSDCIVALN